MINGPQFMNMIFLESNDLGAFFKKEGLFRYLHKLNS